MQHGVGEEAQFLEGLRGGCLVASPWEVAHDLVCAFDHFVHPAVHFLHLAGWGKVKDEDVALLISHLQSAQLLLARLLAL